MIDSTLDFCDACIAQRIGCEVTKFFAQHGFLVRFFEIAGVAVHGVCVLHAAF